MTRKGHPAERIIEVLDGQPEALDRRAECFVLSLKEIWRGSLASRVFDWLTCLVHTEGLEEFRSRPLHTVTADASGACAGNFVEFVPNVTADFGLRPREASRNVGYQESFIWQRDPIIWCDFSGYDSVWSANDSRVIQKERQMQALTRRCWEGIRLASVPVGARVAGVVDQVMVTWITEFGTTEPAEAITRLGWSTRVRALSGVGTSIRSLLVPLLGGGFSVVVNGEHAPDEAEIRWLTAHEFGHSLFYTDDAPPRRIISQSSREEVFCDQFADLVCAG